MKLIMLLMLLAIAVSKVLCDPTNGDIRLVHGDADSTSGRLEIYMNNAWGTVCYDYNAINGGQGAARAACRQLGFDDYVRVGNVTTLGYPLGTDEISLSNVYCYGASGSDWNDATQHILRCSYSNNPNPNKCAHGDDMAIICESTSKYDLPYDSEVRLTGGDFPSNGILEVYLNNEWGAVCAQDFFTSGADTACRQMGYTGSSDHSFITDSTKKVWLNDITCGGSKRCLNLCFDYPSYGYVPPCPSNQLSVVNCTFNVINPPSAGYGSLCVGYLVSHILAIAIGVVVAVLVVLFLAILIPVIVCCCCIPGCVLFGTTQRRVVYEAI